MSRLLSSPSPWTVPLFLTCHQLRKDRETLAQRVAKRAKASMGGQPPAGTSSTLLVVVESSPESSPQHSTQCAFITRSSSMGAETQFLGVDLAVVVGGEQQQEEPLRATLDTPPPSTTPHKGHPPQGRQAPSPCAGRRRRPWASAAPSLH